MPAPSLLQPFVATFEGRSLTTVARDGEPRWFGPELSLLCSDDPKYVAKMVADSDEFEVGATHDLITGKALADLKALGLVRHSRTSSGEEVSEPIVHRFANSAILLREKGLWLVLQKTNADVGAKLRAFLAEHVLPKLARGESVGGQAVALPSPEALATANTCARLAEMAQRTPELRHLSVALLAKSIEAVGVRVTANPDPQRPLFKAVPVGDVGGAS